MSHFTLSHRPRRIPTPDGGTIAPPLSVEVESVVRVIEVACLRKAYGTTVAVEDVSFGVDEGEIFGILGPNGAGKTTTVECMSGLRVPDGGMISVLGLDPQRDRHAIRQVEGVQLQEGSIPSLTARARSSTSASSPPISTTRSFSPQASCYETRSGGPRLTPTPSM